MGNRRSCPAGALFGFLAAGIGIIGVILGETSYVKIFGVAFILLGIPMISNTYLVAQALKETLELKKELQELKEQLKQKEESA